MPWVEKHRPKCWIDIKGQFQAIEKIKDFIKSFDNALPAKKAVILYGPPGTGKTTLAHVAALETNSEIFELNASDLRNKIKLNEILKPAIEQKSLTKNNKIILVDEVDGISATDRGGLIELISLISSSNYPIIITANDIWDRKFSELRQKCDLVKLKELDYQTIKDVMICLLKKEKLFIDNKILTVIAVKARGDLRAAINDLQAASNIKDLSPDLFDERNKEIDIFNALRSIFKSKPTNELLSIFDSVNMSIDDIILWVEENIPIEYKGEALAKAIDALSKADIFKGRIYKQQYWRFLVYENILLSYAISASKSGQIPGGFTSYKKPTRILKIWMHNQRTQQKKTIAQKYAAYVHVGVKRAMHEFPIIKQIINSKPGIAKELRLDEEELEYLRK